MAIERACNLRHQFWSVLWQIAFEGQRVGGMVGAKDDRRGRINSLDQSDLLVQHIAVILPLEGFLETAVKFIFYIPIKSELQCGEEIEPGSVDPPSPIIFRIQ